MREYLLVFLVAGTVTYLLTVIAREIALRTGAVAAVRDRDVHTEPIPYLGGIAMLGGLAAAYLVARELPFLSRSEPFVFRDAGVVLLAGALVCAVGVLDDIFDLDALTKFGGQVLAAALLVVLRGAVLLLPAASDGSSQFVLDPAQGALLSVVIVIATINAVNFVDGLDGLAAGVVGIGAMAFFLFCYVLAGAERPHARHDRRPAHGRPGRRLRRLPAAQLPPGPALHGRLRLDADRAGALGQRPDPDRAVRRATRSPPTATASSSRCCRCCCRSRC